MDFSKYGALTIDKMTTFIRIIMPLYGVMLTLSGRAISAVSFPLSIMVSIGLINELIKNIFMPIIYAYLAVSCIGSVSSNKGLDRLAEMLKGMFVWGLSLSLTFFGMVLALQKGTLSVADNASLNTIRYAIGFVVPIVGKIISDSADIVLGSAGVILGAFGIFGIIVMIGICALPVIRIGVYALVYKILSVIGLWWGITASRSFWAISAILFPCCWP
jgi:stage III sporulation protein AE